MSVNLVLAFDRFGFTERKILCSERHRLDWVDYDAFESLKNSSILLTEGVLWYDDDLGAVATEADAYGEPITYVSAQVLLLHLDKAQLTGFDAAIREYVRHIPGKTRVVLYWS